VPKDTSITDNLQLSSRRGIYLQITKGERLARRKRVVAVKNGNCFIEGGDFSKISRLAAELNRVETIACLRKLCERWIYHTCLCFALPNVERERSCFAYQYSVFQLELSRTILPECGLCVPTSSYGRKSSSRYWLASSVPVAGHPKSPPPWIIITLRCAKSSIEP
jgi:hypothetical protein